MTKSTTDLFAYISSTEFNPDIFKSDLKAIKNLNIDQYVGTTKATFLGEAARCLNIAAVEILLKDFRASTETLTQGEGRQIWTPVYWTVYNSDKSTFVNAAERLQILDQLREAGANMEPLIKSEGYHMASCNSLISYAKGTMIKDFLLHGISPKATDSRNTGTSHISKDTMEIIDVIKSQIAEHPKDYLYIVALHQDIKLGADVEPKALNALKNGADPKMFQTYTKYALKLLHKIAQEFIQEPSLFLKTTLHYNSLKIVEDELIKLGSSLENIQLQSYQDFTHKAFDPKVEDTYTNNAKDAITKLATDLQNNPILLLYYTLHKQTTKEVELKLQELKTSFKAIATEAKQALENGVSPKEESSSQCTTNAKLALQKITTDLQNNPMKFLYITLHPDSELEISRDVIENIKNKVNDSIKKGDTILYDPAKASTPNAIEAITRLAEELKSDPKLWLHVNLSESVISSLSVELTKASSSLDNIKKVATDMIKDGENPETNGACLDNAWYALVAIKEELSKDNKQWLYINLDMHALKTLTDRIGLDLNTIKAGAKSYLEEGGAMKLEGKCPTPNAASLIAELANKYISDRCVPSNAFFHQDTKESISLIFRQGGAGDLCDLLHTDLSRDVVEAMAPDSESTEDSTKNSLVQNVEASKTSSWLGSLGGYLWSSSETAQTVKPIDNQEITNISLGGDFVELPISKV